MKRIIFFCICFSLALSSCAPVSGTQVIETPATSTPQATVEPSPTPLPTREPYPPGTLVDYKAQSGDTLPSLAAHFNTTVEEIRAANPVVPQDVTTLPAGLPMKIPIYYQTLWGSSFQIIPDSAFVNGPALGNFSAAEFVPTQPGWLKDYTEYAANDNRTGGEIVDYVAVNFSVSPRLLLALLEYQAGALTEPVREQPDDPYILGYREVYHQGLFMQLVWAANTLNNAYYGWRIGSLKEFEHLDNSLERPDPWQNAASVAIQYYFSRLMGNEAYQQATHSQGLLRSYQRLFGDPWANDTAPIPGNLVQPALRLPFLPGINWAYTGGPHTAWGTGEPFSAIDFAPGSTIGGCSPTKEWAVAVADGIIVRNDTGVAVLDLDGDGNERTGWVIFYLHLATDGLAKTGTVLKSGDPIGHPSCEGGKATGTHVHIARKYNGEWILADGLIPFSMEGWIVKNGAEAYKGRLEKDGRIIQACDCSDKASQLQSSQPK